jgi:hypothetical protein
LLDPERFRNFYLDEWPTLAWSCGFDVAPETLYELATGKSPWGKDRAYLACSSPTARDGSSVLA